MLAHLDFTGNMVWRGGWCARYFFDVWVFYEDENETYKGDDKYEAVELDEEEDNDNSNIESNEGDDLILPHYSAYSGGRGDMTKNTCWFFRLTHNWWYNWENCRLNKSLCQPVSRSNGELRRYSRVRVWNKAFCGGELLKFLCIFLYMDLIRYPKLEDYWSTTSPFHICTFSNVASQDRFSVILRFFHLNDSLKFIPKGSPS